MRIPALIAACAAAVVLPASAQTLKPGLWEIRNKVDNAEMNQAMAQMQQQMAAMPPQQRKQMEAMMAQQGVRMAPGGGAGGGMSVQMCMTKEMAERQGMPMEDGCRMTKQERSGKTMKYAFACTQPPSSGEGEVTFTSPEAYSSRMVVRVVEQGRTQTTKMETAGRWLKADCGSLKPAQPAKK